MEYRKRYAADDPDVKYALHLHSWKPGVVSGQCTQIAADF